jgi:hypothetical protein
VKTARDTVLFEGLTDLVDLGRIHWLVLQEHSDVPLSEVQNSAMSLIRSLVADGLYEVGDVSGKGGSFVKWDSSLEESMQRIQEMYVAGHPDMSYWAWACWLRLTEKGWPVARSVGGVDNAREDVLLDGLSGVVDLGSVHWYVTLDQPSEQLSEWQSETLSLVQSLAAEGLVKVGDFADKSGDFVAWHTPLDESMQRIYKLYVEYFDAKLGWPYEVWLTLTEKGEMVARSVDANRQESREG